MKKKPDLQIITSKQLDNPSSFIPYMKTIQEAIKQNKVSVDDIIANLSYRNFMRVGSSINSELYDALFLPSTKHKKAIKKFFDAFDTMTKEEFEKRKAELAGQEIKRPEVKLPVTPIPLPVTPDNLTGSPLTDEIKKAIKDQEPLKIALDDLRNKLQGITEKDKQDDAEIALLEELLRKKKTA